MRSPITQKNIQMLIGLISVFIALWLLIYIIPSIFVSLFETLLGNLVLIGLTILALYFNPPAGVGMGVVFILLYRFAHLHFA